MLLDNKIEEYCERYGLDGIDLDIELGSGDAIWDNYGIWVADLRSVCDEHGWLLSTATAQWVAQDVSEEIFAMFDYINVMAYDDDKRGRTSHASYEFALDCLEYFGTTKNIPRGKLVLGVPFYGRGYTSEGSLDWNSYVSFADLIADNAENYSRDEYDGIAYNGADSMRAKCELAKDYGGIMIWEISQDAEGEYSLLQVIKEEILPEPDPNIPDDRDEKNNTIAIVILTITGALVLASAAVFAIIAICKRSKK